MKKKWRLSASIAELLLFWVAATMAAPLEARANTELDRQFALETVGCLRAWDNVDGLFADYVNQAYKEYFARQSRFRSIELSKADEVLSSSKLPYHKLIDDPAVLGQVARSLRAESLIRTRIYKEGPRYRITIDWLHSPRMELISSEAITLDEPRDGKSIGAGDISGTFHQALDRMIGKVPFRGHVTGRDEGSVTVNIGESSGLRKGDTLTLATLDEVKKHPLLKAIVDWRLVATGKAEVEEVEDGMAFCKIVAEEPGRRVSRYQKVIHVSQAQSDESSLKVHDDSKSQLEAELAEPPTLGYLAIGLWPGIYSRQVTGSLGAFNKDGGGLFFGGKAEGQLWLNRNIFADLGLGYGFATYSQEDVLTGAESSDIGGGLTAIAFKLAAGYNFFASTDFFGPRGWARLGFQSISYKLPVSLAEGTGPSSHTGLFVGIGGDLPVRGAFGALLNLDFGILNGASFQSATADSATFVDFFIGGYYRHSARMTVRVGFDIIANGADFNTQGSSVTQKVMTLGPSLLYYF